MFLEFAFPYMSVFGQLCMLSAVYSVLLVQHDYENRGDHWGPAEQYIDNVGHGEFPKALRR